METLLLNADEAGIKRAAELLLDGQVVGIPTETVYGLAADALNSEAVGRIFEAKGRPQDNPLIVHIAEWGQLEQVASEIPDSARRLGQAFWPGPLTMILKRSKLIPDIVTAGLDTVGIRMPSHPAARRIIELSRPLAAPSANTSGKPSPTTAQHVYHDMKGRVSLIVDGGACGVGVESTVVDMTGGVPRILRPGAITEEMIAEVLGSASTDEATRVGLAEGQTARSPGMKYKHYAPAAPVVLYEGAPNDTFSAILREKSSTDGIICFDEYRELLRNDPSLPVYSLGPSWDHREHSQRLFAILRDFDSTDVKRVLAQCPRPLGSEEGAVNRLRRAAGFNCISCSPRPIIGVTGASGSGKSLFSSLLCQKLGDCLLLDADKIYHELLADADGEMCRKILETFPDCETGGLVNRKKLGKTVFENKESLVKLNSLTHGFVIDKTLNMIAESRHSYIIADVPLLFESGFDRYCTLTVGLLAPRELSAGRITARDKISAESAALRLASQPEDKFYTERCDITIKNHGGQTELEKAAASIAGKYLKS